MASSTTNYHAKYFAYELIKAGGHGLDCITQSLFNASVDLNPNRENFRYPQNQKNEK